MKKSTTMAFTKEYINKHISKLELSDKALWGIMTPQHMIEHVIYLFRMSLGEIQQDLVTPLEKVERYQKSLYGERRLPKFFKAPNLKDGELESLEFPTFESSKEALLAYYDKYEAYYRKNPDAKNVHVFYGNLDKEKWDLIHMKHCDHHFRQFDLRKKLANGYVDRSIDKYGIGIIEFYHPRHNALPGELLREIVKAMNFYSTHPKCEVILLKSGGDRTFCAGANFDELLAIKNEEDGKSFFMGFANLINAIRNSKKLVIGRIQGKAVGGGVGIASAVDYCFATKHGAIKLSELNIGIGPFVIAPAVERKIGLAAFSQLTLDFTKFYDADWAQDKGLYQSVHESAETMDIEIKSFLMALAATNPEARLEMKKTLWQKTEHWDRLLGERATVSGRLVLSEFTKSQLGKMKPS